MKFQPKGPERWEHQKRGLQRLIQMGGTGILAFDPGCLTGDAELIINRAGNGTRITLQDLYLRYHGLRGKWRSDVETKTQRMSDDGSIRLVTITGVYDSGEQDVYQLTLQDGRTLRGTFDHPVYTTDGFIPLGEIGTDHEVYADAGKHKGGNERVRGERKRYVVTYTQYHPNQRKAPGTRGPGSGYRVSKHRVVVEAWLNGLTYSEFTRALQTDPDRSKTFHYLRPDQVVHHLNSDHRDNRLDNLHVTTQRDHAGVHHDHGNNVLARCLPTAVESVQYVGRETTYDVTVENEPHNFLANGMVVHNTGKSATALDFASLLALKQPTDTHGIQEARVLVICPLAAVDTWVTEAEKHVSDQVNVWAEVLSGSIPEKVSALAARGGNPYKKSLAKHKGHPRALHARKATFWHARADGREGHREITRTEGPDGLGSAKPRLVLEIMNIDGFSSRQPYQSGTMADHVLNGVQRFGPHLVIIDELHKIKGANSNVSRLAARIGDRSSRKIGLTGTLMPTGPLDVYGQTRFIDPYLFGSLDKRGVRKKATFSDFDERYVTRGGYLGKEIKGFRNLDEFQDILARRAVVVRKEDALDLPPISHVTVPVTLSSAEANAYEDMRGKLRTQLMGGSEVKVGNRLAQMMRLRQITSGHVGDEQGRVHELGSSKVSVIDSLVHDTLAGENRIVIFSVFTHEIEALQRKLARKGTTIFTVTGETKDRDRNAQLKTFGDASDDRRIVFLAQIQTMSLAINDLVTASNVLFGSMTQKRDELIQARDRLYRAGQQRAVTCYYTVAPETVDEITLQAHNDRSDLEDRMLKHVLETENERAA